MERVESRLNRQRRGKASGLEQVHSGDRGENGECDFAGNSEIGDRQRGYGSSNKCGHAGHLSIRRSRHVLFGVYAACLLLSFPFWETFVGKIGHNGRRVTDSRENVGAPTFLIFCQ